MLKTNSLLNTDSKDDRLKQIDVYKNHSKFMKSKVRVYSLPETKINLTVSSFFFLELTEGAVLWMKAWVNKE